MFNKLTEARTIHISKTNRGYSRLSRRPAGKQMMLFDAVDLRGAAVWHKGMISDQALSLQSALSSL